MFFLSLGRSSRGIYFPIKFKLISTVITQYEEINPIEIYFPVLRNLLIDSHSYLSQDKEIQEVVAFQEQIEKQVEIEFLQD